MDKLGCLVIVFFFSLIAGLGYLVEGEILYAVLWLLFPIISIVYVVYKWPHCKREEALHKMYNYPETISLEFGDQWNREFQGLISKAIDSTNDPEKKSNLKSCQKVVKNIKDDAGFYYLQRTFRLTGCHISITDSNGKCISTIV